MGQSNLPLASGSEHVKAFRVFGWMWDGKRRGRGKHFILTKPHMRPALSIPDHREVKRTIIADLIALAGITETDYVSAFLGTYEPPDGPPETDPAVRPAETSAVPAKANRSSQRPRRRR
jgi:hypothetical protein